MTAVAALSPAPRSEISLRGGSGLGDSLYVQAIARHLVAAGERIEVCSDWPDVFRPLVGPGGKSLPPTRSGEGHSGLACEPGRKLRPDREGSKVRVSPFRRDRIDRVAHYTARKGIAGTSQFEDCCLRAGIDGPVALRLDWRPGDRRLIDIVRGDRRRPVVAVLLPRAPMGRRDGFGAELLPDCAAIQRIIDRIGGGVRLVQVGAGEPLWRFRGLDRDIANRTTVAQLLDVASAVDGFLGYVSFVVPLAESLGKPALIVWSRRGLNATSPRGAFIRQITPQKVIHRPELVRAVIDDCDREELAGAADALLERAQEESR